MEDTIVYRDVELPVEYTRAALEEATDENGNITNIGYVGGVVVIGDKDPDSWGMVGYGSTDESASGYLSNLEDELPADPYDEAFEALKEATDGSFDIDIREVEIVDTRSKFGDHNAAVVLEKAEPWNLEMNCGGWPYDDFNLQYFRSGPVDESVLNRYGIEMDNVGAIFYFALDE